METKTVKININIYFREIIGRSLAKYGTKVPNHVTTLNPYKSGLEWTFEALPVGSGVGLE